MAKIQKSYRFEESTVNDLQRLIDFYNLHLSEFSVKKAVGADVLTLLIEKEIEQLRKQGSNI